jgi:hypothetical protein
MKDARPYVISMCMTSLCLVASQVASAADINTKSDVTTAQTQAVEPGVSLPQALTRGRVPKGYSVGNFGIAAAISADGLSITRSLINPPVFGEWLKSFGRGGLVLSAGGHSDFQTLDQYSVFPENCARLSSTTTQVEARVETFAPLGLTSADNTSFDNFLPALIVGVHVVNHGARPQVVTLKYEFFPNRRSGGRGAAAISVGDVVGHEMHETSGSAQIWLLSTTYDEEASMASAVRNKKKGGLNRTVTIAVPGGQERAASFVLGVYDPRGYTSARFASRVSMERYVLEGVASPASVSSDALRGSRLYKQRTDFIAMLPRTGDPELDVYSRWYLSAGVLLTKGVRSGEVLTMGYSELNQRDSFWTTGAHLVLWPDLELKMLQESMTAQLPNGQIPMTILPIILRDKNIDGNEYFILRTARYLRWYRDESFLHEALPYIRKALSYLESLDTDDIGLPRQVSYWADWKDVPGVEGRTYAPHFALLWLATLKEAQFIAAEAGDRELAKRLGARYDRGYQRVNQDVTAGGLWDHTRYVDRWKDGRNTPYTLEDQVLSAIFDVIPSDRLESIYATLNAANESPYGVRETYPYIHAFAQPYGEAQYHDGGIWPYLNCADAWGRYKNHHAADAERIIKEVAFNDLVRNNDFEPGEFLDGDTGKNNGFSIQGWDAACFSAIYFGGFGLDRIKEDELMVNLNLPSDRDVSTDLRIPHGNLSLKRESGHVCASAKLEPASHISVAGITSCTTPGIARQ